MDAAREPRPEHEVLAAAPIAVTLGGREKRLPPLSIRANREWKRKVAEAVGASWVAFGQADDTGSIVGLVAGATDTMLDLLLEYDMSGSLGGREWIEEHASDAEVYQTMKEVLAVAYPPFQDARTMPGLGQALVGLVASVSQGRTSLSPTSGVTSPDKSTSS
jgi:hypothetical protein